MFKKNLSLQSDNRGQTTLIGFVLVIAIIVVALSFYTVAEQGMQTESEVVHNDELDRSLIDLQSKTQSATITTQQTSVINSEVNYQRGILYNSILKHPFSISTEQTSASISYQDIDNESQTISTNSDSLQIEKQYNYIDDATYSFEHSFIHRQANGDSLVSNPIVFPDDSTIVIQNQTVNIDSSSQSVINAQITASESSQSITPDSEVTYRVETDTPVSEVERQVNNSAVQNIERDGDDIVFTLDEKEYTVVTQNITITV